MPTPIEATFVGEQGYTEQPIERTFDPKRGPSTTRRFKGRKAALLDLKAQFDAAKWNTRFIDGPVPQLEATAGIDYDGGQPPVETPVDTWELGANVTEKDILQSDSSLVASAISNLGDLKILRDLLKGTRKFEDTASGDFSQTAGGADAVSVSILISAGVTSRVIYQPILKHSQTVSNNYAIPNSLSNVGSVIKTSTLLTQESIPSSISNNLTASSSVTKQGLVYWYGWLKQHPTISVAAFQKTTIAQEWQWGLWPAGLFTVI